MKKLQGKIIKGLQQCEDIDIVYKAYVMRDLGKEIEILDHENLDEWLRCGGHLQTFCVDRTEVVDIIGRFDMDMINEFERLNKMLE